MKDVYDVAVQEILALCESTGGWYGIKIISLNDRNHLGDTPLHTACSWGELEPVKQLVFAGADVNARGDHGSTPLFNAVIGESPEVIKFLLQSGANVKIKNDMGWSVLSYAKNISAPKDVIDALVNWRKPA
ncbi:MAG: ankyrin repeat domain-containing protein [Pseudomonadota bacterium]|nr:ankyrin repeat domain-containing protein [Pseudomonadota bacterium]